MTQDSPRPGQAPVSDALGEPPVFAAPGQAPVSEAAEPRPIFAAPWEAQVFALVVCLHDRGTFGWTEWTEALGAETRRSGAPADYAAWLATIESLLARRGVAPKALLASRRAAFARAAAVTPHGEPILLANDPLGQHQPTGR